MKKIEKSEVTKVSGKGLLMGIDSSGITLQDLKEGTTDKILFSDLNDLIGKEITIAFQNKEEV